MNVVKKLIDSILSNFLTCLTSMKYLNLCKDLRLCDSQGTKSQSFTSADHKV